MTADVLRSRILGALALGDLSGCRIARMIWARPNSVCEMLWVMWARGEVTKVGKVWRRA